MWLASLFFLFPSSFVATLVAAATAHWLGSGELARSWRGLERKTRQRVLVGVFIVAPLVATALFMLPALRSAPFVAAVLWLVLFAHTTDATIDIDLVIEARVLGKTKELAAARGYRFEAAPMSFKGGAIEIRRLSKVDSESGDVLTLDLLLVTPSIERAWKERIRVPWRHTTVSVVDRRGLIQLKQLRGSGQDQDDIQRLEAIDDDA